MLIDKPPWVEHGGENKHCIDAIQAGMQRHKDLISSMSRAGLLALSAEPENFRCIVLASHFIECVDDHLQGPLQDFCVFLKPKDLFRM